MPEPGGTISIFWNAFAPHCNESEQFFSNYGPTAIFGTTKQQQAVTGF
jgi:hypothetical protein